MGDVSSSHGSAYFLPYSQASLGWLNNRLEKFPRRRTNRNSRLLSIRSEHVHFLLTIDGNDS